MARSMIARQNIKLNLVPGGVSPVLNVSQDDSAYDVHFTIYNGAQLFEIPDDVSIQFQETKRDGNGFVVGATKSAQTGQCYIWMQEQMSAVPGDQICELVLTNTTGDQIGTANFIMRVEPAALDKNTVISDSEIAYARQVLAQLGSVAAYKEQLDAQGDEIDQLNTDLAAEVAARQAADNTLQSNINSEASTRATADAALQSQINQLVAPEGAAPSAAEIENARVGADGTVYPTLGDAIRTQDTQLKDAITQTETAVKGLQTLQPVDVTMVRHQSIGIISKQINTNVGASFYLSSPISVIPGELYRITCEGYGSAAAYAFGTDGTIAAVFPESYDSASQLHYVIDKLVLVPDGANELYISNTSNGGVTTYGVSKVISVDPVLYTGQTKTDSEKSTARKNIDAVGFNEFSDIADAHYNAYSLTENTSKIINSFGIVTDYDNANYAVSNYIDVSNASMVMVTGSANFRNSICVFYNSEHEVISIALKSTTGTAEGTTFVDEILKVPSGAIYMVVAAAGTTRVLSASYLDRYVPKKKFTGLKWAAVGDSLTEVNSRTTKHYHDYIADETGISVYNMGVSGTGYKRREDVDKAFYQRVLNIPTDADVVTIFGSGNDQTYYGSAMGTATDTGTDTLGGCINTTIDNIYSILPTVQLGIIAPCPWQGYNPVNHNNGMATYTELLRQICANRSIPFLDLYHTSNLRPWDANFRALAYSKDDGGGTHPDETGHKLLAGRVRVFLESLIGAY